MAAKKATKKALAIATDANVNHRTMRQLRAYATGEGEAPLKKRRLEDLAPAVARLAPPADDGKELAELPLATLQEGVLKALKGAAIRTTTKMQLKTVAAISSTQPGKPRKIVSHKMTDRQMGIALSVMQLCEQGCKPIVIASCPGTAESNASVSSLGFLMTSKLKVAHCAFVNRGESMPSKNGDCRAFVVDANAVSSIPASLGQSFTHVIIWHEGGKQDSLVLPSFMAKASQTIVVPSLSQLSDPFLGKVVEMERPTATTTVPVQLIVADGIPRLQALWSMLTHLCGARKQKVVVAFHSRETVAFHCDLFNALPSSDPPFSILCDWESNVTDSKAVQQDFVEADTNEGGVALLTCFQFTEGAETVIQYDPAPLSTYFQSIALVSESQTKTRSRSRSASRTPKRGTRPSKASVDKTFVLFLYPAEEKLVPQAMKASSQAEHYMPSFEKVQLPSATTQAAAVQKIRSLVKNMFILAKKAFDAYKASMAIYARLQPQVVFNVRSLNLEKVAQQFGLTEVPLLDLRLKDNEFRPQEDYVKPAMKRKREELRRIRQRAAALPVDDSPIDSDEEASDVGAD